MTLPILLIFYVSKWKNNKKHWKIGIWRHCDVIIGRGNWVWDFFLRRWSLCVNFMTLVLLVPEIQRGGPRSFPPQVTDWPKKPSLNRVKIINYFVFVLRPSISGLLQSATAYFTTKSNGLLLQSVISVITKCDRDYKVRQFYYKVRRLLESATERTYTLSTVYIAELTSIPHRPHIYPLPFLTARGP